MVTRWDSTKPRLIFLECGHVKAVSALDSHIGLAASYVVIDGKWHAPQNMIGAVTKIPECPECKKPVTANRYKRLYNSSVMNRSDLKDMLQFEVDIRPFYDRLSCVDASSLSNLLDEIALFNHDTSEKSSVMLDLMLEVKRASMIVNVPVYDNHLTISVRALLLKAEASLISLVFNGLFLVVNTRLLY